MQLMKYNVLLPSRNLQLTALLKGGGKEGKEEKSRGFEKMLRKGSLPHLAGGSHPQESQVPPFI